MFEKEIGWLEDYNKVLKDRIVKLNNDVFKSQSEIAELIYNIEENNRLIAKFKSKSNT